MGSSPKAAEAVWSTSRSGMPVQSTSSRSSSLTLGSSSKAAEAVFSTSRSGMPVPSKGESACACAQ
eukprot:7553130-Heterocapsa_arctica.AAC.1